MLQPEALQQWHLLRGEGGLRLSEFPRLAGRDIDVQSVPSAQRAASCLPAACQLSAGCLSAAVYLVSASCLPAVCELSGLLGLLANGMSGIADPPCPRAGRPRDDGRLRLAPGGCKAGSNEADPVISLLCRDVAAGAPPAERERAVCSRLECLRGARGLGGGGRLGYPAHG